MVYLRDADNAARLAVIRPTGLWLLGAIRSRLLKQTKGRHVSGQFGKIGGTPAAVYLAGGKLWLAVADQAWFLDEVSADIEQADDAWLVRINTPKETYEAHAARSSDADDTTAFADDEDFFFGLWVARIIHDERRKQVLKQTLKDASLKQVPERTGPEAPAHVVDPRTSWDRSSTDLGDGRRAHD